MSKYHINRNTPGSVAPELPSVVAFGVIRERPRPDGTETAGACPSARQGSLSDAACVGGSPPPHGGGRAVPLLCFSFLLGPEDGRLSQFARD